MKGSVLKALALSVLVTACKTPTGETTLKDTGITTAATRDQGGTAFCWSYALIAHVEQRYYELTRGPGRGGFRLNLSEEYLGLIHLASQLISGKPVSEGKKLSETLALIEKYGLVPEKVGDKTLFRAAFEMPLGREVNDRANQDWAELGLAENAPLPVERAVAVVADVAELTTEQRAFLAAAMGAGDEKAAHFRFANRDYTPRTFATERLKFVASDYQVLTFPDPATSAYAETLRTVKKAMLYGYSVPISLNFVTESSAENGTIGCLQPGCAAADISVGTPEWPHANHAVLLVDYRGAGGAFLPVDEATLAPSLEAMPVEWVIRNSWGFNNTTSTDKNLLKRFPLPAYTTMTQEFFAAGHRLRPGRFEAIVPKNVCLRELTPERKLRCAPLVGSELDAPLLLGNLKQAPLARDPVEFDASARELPDDSVLKIDVAATTQDLCINLEVGPRVKYVAAFLEGEKTPRLVFSADARWRYCAPWTPEGPKTLNLVFEPLDDHYKALGRTRREIKQPEPEF